MIISVSTKVLLSLFMSDLMPSTFHDPNLLSLALISLYKHYLQPQLFKFQLTPLVTLLLILIHLLPLQQSILKPLLHALFNKTIRLLLLLLILFLNPLLINLLLPLNFFNHSLQFPFLLFKPLLPNLNQLLHKLPFTKLILLFTIPHFLVPHLKIILPNLDPLETTNIPSYDPY